MYKDKEPYINPYWTCIDMTTLGASRVARKAANATKDTCNNISKDLDK